MRQAIRKALWLAAMMGAVAGLLDFTFTSADSAPQQAALAARSCAWAVLPYVLARAWDEFTRNAKAAVDLGERTEKVA